ncbi:hypothetical protein GDO81_025102 [Engystomops pustulosus]|uniref:Uncharacterized protein n=1 Tax=Engystomops pustulosus TaxID=76066 RepID=A0AAV6Z0X3_ENGPU|nr:hypothetical protein GDO81_025102 [Engystomops pustulosus]
MEHTNNLLDSGSRSGVMHPLLSPPMSIAAKIITCMRYPDILYMLYSGYCHIFWKYAEGPQIFTIFWGTLHINTYANCLHMYL